MDPRLPESSSNRREINLDEYPERVGCYIIPTFDVSVTDVEVLDAEDSTVRTTVPLESVQSLKVGTLYYSLPEDKREFLEEELTAGMVRCRVVEALSGIDLVRIELPAVAGAEEAIITKQRLVRKVE